MTHEIHLERRPIPDQLRYLAQHLREAAEGIEAEKHGQLYGIVIGLEMIADDLDAEADDEDEDEGTVEP